MEEPKKPIMEILEICKIIPSPSPSAEFSLPLTILDLPFFLASPIERILYYSFATNHEPPPFDSILENLKHSLSLTLSHFLPLAGNLVWPNESSEPFILYKTGDSVSLTIAKTDADFNHLSGSHVRKANESRFLLPTISNNNNVVPSMCLQITLFPKSGFSIGITSNHVVVDGKTSTMFLKSWASICTRLESTLPPELTPVFDRTAASDTNELRKLYVEYFDTFIPNPKTFNLPPKVAISDDVVRGTFELTRADIQNLRTKVEATNSLSTPGRRLTTFVLTFAYVSTCMVKSERSIDPKSKIALSFLVDWRSRLGALGGLNYFGNGISGYGLFFEAREFLEDENIMAMVSNKISDGVAEIEERAKQNKVVELFEEISMRWRKEMPVSKNILVAGSPKFGIYDLDFGLGGGGCNKQEIVSINPSGSFSMIDSRNGIGGVELGIVLPSEAMNAFCSLFSEGLKKQC